MATDHLHSALEKRVERILAFTRRLGKVILICWAKELYDRFWIPGYTPE